MAPSGSVRTALFASLFLAIGQASACDVKLVFSRWCLGAPVAEQLRDARIALDRQVGNQRYIHLAKDESSRTVMLTVFEEKIASVSRTHAPGNALVYTDLMKQLAALYGEPDDLSVFPAYATDWDSKDLAIRLSKGRASHQWMQPTFRISLRWSNDRIVLLTYLDKDLALRAHKSRPSDL